MGLSGKEIKRVIDDYKKSYLYNKDISDKDDGFIQNMWGTITKKGNSEQYRIADLQKDLRKFKKVLKEIKMINTGLLIIIKQNNKI